MSRMAKRLWRYRPLSFWRLRVRLDGEAWQRFFDSFHRSAWRLELHPIYSMPQEREPFARFLAGERLPADDRSEWMDRVAAHRANGRSIGRVHVVRRPLTDYLRFEFNWYYQFHIKVGEDIRILDLTDRPGPGLPEEDFWMFDEATVVVMRYRPDGTQIGRELLDAPDIEQILRYRDIALSGAVPFAEYWAGLDESVRA
jgi:hypothetical protein